MEQHTAIYPPVHSSRALDDIMEERHRQISAEGWTPEHDDAHTDRSLAVAGACYAIAASAPIDGNSSVFDENIKCGNAVRALWPWDWKWWKSSDRRRNLVKAGALIVAEIERLDRAALQPST